MKKLNKLQINSEKIMKNEELTMLRGGYDQYDCSIYRDGEWIASAECWGDSPPICANDLTYSLNAADPEHDYYVDCGCR